MSFIRANLFSFIALGVMIAASLILWGSLPDQVPSHFNARGEVDDCSPKELVASLLPFVFVVLIAVVNVLVRISPRKFSMPNSKHAMDIILAGIGAMMVFLHLGLLLHGGEFDVFVRFFSWGMALFLLITGNVFGKTERNFFMGLRTPWTLASHANWKATHRFMGRLMVASGLALLLINTFYSNIWITVVLCVGPVLAPVVFSVLYYFRNERGAPEEDGAQ